MSNNISSGIFSLCLYRWEDDRVALPWDDATVWSAMKPTMPWGQLPCLTYKVMIMINEYDIDQIFKPDSKVKTQRTWADSLVLGTTHHPPEIVGRPV